MRHSRANLLVLTACAGLGTTASAEWRCDCTTIVDSCSAQVNVEDTFVEVTTQAAQCARVDYLIDGMPFVSLAVEGSARENWIARGENPRVLVQSCQVCADNAGAADPQTPRTTAENAAAGDLTPLVAPEPTYPRQAQERGIEGTVTVEFTVDPYGDTQDVHVVSAQPAGVFDMAAVSAVSRWRYPADGEREPVTRTETLEFSIDDFLFTALPGPQPQTAADNATRTTNQCVRETTTYNFGEMIEVELINACAEPLSIFACAVGTGATAQRWVCTSSDQNDTIIVRPGDAGLRGSTVLARQDGARRFRYAENFFVARAPNTEYWWMACASSDERCGNEARQWSRSLDRQDAHVDPQMLTRADVARSY